MINKELILGAEKTFLLLEVNQGYDYAKKIYEQRKGKNISEKIKIQRQLISLEKDLWLTKKIIQPKNKKIYSLNWEFIINSFIEHFLNKLDETQLHIINELYFKNNLINLVGKNKKFNIKIVKNSKKEERSLLIPFFKDIFPLAYDFLISNKLKINMEELFEEIIIGIGKTISFTSLKGVEDKKLMYKNPIKCNPFILNLIIPCFHIGYYNTLERFNNLISKEFPNRFNSNKDI